MKQSLSDGNRGALFYLIVFMLPLDIEEIKRNFESCLNSSLKRLNLSLDKLERASRAEAKEIFDVLSNSPLKGLKDLAEAGYENFKKIFPNKIHYPLGDLNMPPALLGDENMTRYLFNVSEGNKLRRFDLDFSYSELVECQLRSENFSEGCL